MGEAAQLQAPTPAASARDIEDFGNRVVEIALRGFLCKEGTVGHTCKVINRTVIAFGHSSGDDFCWIGCP